jgi:hypothetical protein
MEDSLSGLPKPRNASFIKVALILTLLMVLAQPAFAQGTHAGILPPMLGPMGKPSTRGQQIGGNT